jgi:hypothetical protein
MCYNQNIIKKEVFYMKKRRLAAILLSLLSFNALNSSKLSLNLLPTQSCSAEQIIKRPLVICVMGENKDYNNAVASLVLANDDEARLGDIRVTKFNPMELYEAKNNPNLKVGVITYDPKINDFNQIDSIFKDKFDCMDIIIHVSNKNTFTFDKIKSFYDKLNEAWVGKDVYKTMVYSTNGEDGRMKMWHYLMGKYSRGNKFIPRQFFPIYNGTEKSLKNQSDYIQLNNYVSGMPDARSIYAINLNDENATLQPIIESINYELASVFSKENTIWKIETLKKKLQNGVFRLENSPTQEQHSNKCSTIQTKIQTHTQPQVLQPNRSLSSGQIGLICSLAGIGAISAAVAGVLIKKKLSTKPKITKPEVKNQEVNKPGK